MSSPLIHGERRTTKAFTLIELLTVITIIGILSGLVFGLAKGVKQRANAGVARTELATLATALEEYKRQYGDYPQVALSSWSGMTSGNETKLFQALIGRRGPKGDSISGKVLIESAKFKLNSTDDPTVNANQDSVYLVDPWGRQYYYFYKESSNWKAPSYVLFSVGPDGLAYGASSTASALVNNDGSVKSDASTDSGSADNIYPNK